MLKFSKDRANVCSPSKTINHDHARLPARSLSVSPVVALMRVSVCYASHRTCVSSAHQVSLLIYYTQSDQGLRGEGVTRTVLIILNTPPTRAPQLFLANILYRHPIFQRMPVPGIVGRNRANRTPFQSHLQYTHCR